MELLQLVLPVYLFSRKHHYTSLFLAALGEGKGAIRSFYRGCGPSIGNKCEDEINTVRKNCMTSCTQDLCNSGSGYYPHDPTNTSDPDIEVARANNDDNVKDNGTNDNQGNS